MLSTVSTTSTRVVVIGIENRTQNVNKQPKQITVPFSGFQYGRDTLHPRPHTSTPVPAASALGRDGRGLSVTPLCAHRHTGSLGETLLTVVKPLKPQRPTPRKVWDRINHTASIPLNPEDY